MSRLYYLVIATYLFLGVPATIYPDIPIEKRVQKTTAFGLPRSVDITNQPAEPADNPTRFLGGWPVCFGALLDIDVAPLLGVPSATNAREYYRYPRRLCAKQKYGGSSLWNAGFYCRRRSWSEDGSIVTQQYKPASDTSPPSNPIAAIMVFCQLRCQCLPRQDTSDASTTETLVQRIEGVIQSTDTEPYNNQLFPKWADMPLWGFRHSSPGFDVIIQPEVQDVGLPFRNTGRIQHLDLPDYFSEPRCYGLPPAWTLPHPFNRPGETSPPTFLNTFLTNKQLCESGWSLGSRKGNAGGVCKRVQGVYTFKFLDYAAHPSFLESPSSFDPTNNRDTTNNLGAAVRLWCQSWCRCGPFQVNEERQSFTVDTIVRGNSVRATFSLGNIAVVPLSRRGNVRGQAKYFVFSEGLGGGYASLGSEYTGLSSDSLDQPKTCGKSCHGPASKYCSDEEGQEGCRCMIPPASIISNYELDFGAPGAFCIMASALPAFLMAKQKAKAGLLGGRSLDGRTLDTHEKLVADVEEWDCPCNVSYVSKQCCSSNDGLVWEDLYLRLDELSTQ